MPVDTSALVALSDLAAHPAPPPDSAAPRPGRGGRWSGRVPIPTGPARRRLAVLAGASIAAGLVCGLVLPVAPASGPVAAAAAVAPQRTVATLTPAAFLAASPSPFAAVRAGVRASSPAKAARSAGHAVAPRSASGSTTTPGTPAVAAAGLDPLPPRGSARPDQAVAAAAAAPAPASAAYVPKRPLPAHSGTGRRIVYSERAAHLWVVGADGTVLRDYAVTGRVGRPKPGTYHVYSKSPVAVNPGEKLRFEYMVRFTYGLTGARIGFHTIPRYYDGRPIQLESQLGRAIGAGGCVRQSRADAVWLYAWSHVGDTVVVRL